MSIEIKNTEVILRKLLRITSPANINKAIYATTSNLAALIKQRSLKGKGVDGSFKTYSEKPFYRSLKERPIAKGGRRTHKKTGRNLISVFFAGGYKQFAALTKGRSFPDLSASGDMFRSMQAVTAGDFKAKVAFTSAGEGRKAYFVNEQREFMDATSNEKNKLVRFFEKHLSRIIGKEGF